MPMLNQNICLRGIWISSFTNTRFKKTHVVSRYIEFAMLTWMLFSEDEANQTSQACSVIYMRFSMLKVVLTLLSRTKKIQTQIISRIYNCIYLHHHTFIEWCLSYSYAGKGLDQGWNLRGKEDNISHLPTMYKSIMQWPLALNLIHECNHNFLICAKF